MSTNLPSCFRLFLGRLRHPQAAAPTNATAPLVVILNTPYPLPARHVRLFVKKSPLIRLVKTFSRVFIRSSLFSFVVNALSLSALFPFPALVELEVVSLNRMSSPQECACADARARTHERGQMRADAHARTHARALVKEDKSRDFCSFVEITWARVRAY